MSAISRILAIGPSCGVTRVNKLCKRSLSVLLLFLFVRLVRSQFVQSTLLLLLLLLLLLQSVEESSRKSLSQNGYGAGGAGWAVEHNIA